MKSKLNLILNIIRETKVKFLLILILILAITEFLLGIGIVELEKFIRQANIKYIIYYGSILLLFCLIIYILQYCISKGMYLKELSYYQKITSDIINSLKIKDYSYIENYKTDNIVTLFVSDSTIVSKTFTKDFLKIISGISLFVSAIIFGAIVSIELTVFSLVFCPISLVIPKYIGEKLEKSWEQRQESQEDMNSILMQVFENKNILKIFKSENFAIRLLMKKYNKFTDSQLKSAELQWRTIAINTYFGLMFDILNLSFSFYLISLGSLTVGQFLAFSIFIKNFTWIFYDFSSLLISLKKAKVSYERIYNFVRSNNGKWTDKVKPVEEIEFSNISFSYDKENWILSELNFKIAKNEKVLIMGQSGCGKSTLLKTLLGLYKHSEGEVLIEGEKTSVNSNYFSYVPQKVEIFNASLRDNILLGRDLTEEKFINLMKLTTMDKIVKKFQSGLDTMLNEECGMSAGELQILGITRALVDEKILILDEPLANLDRENEKNIIDIIKKIQLPTIIVSHRLENLSEFECYELYNGKLRMI